MSGPNYSKRIDMEFSKLTENLKGDIGLYKLFDGKRSCFGFIRGPEDSSFENGYYKVVIHLPDDYPFSPPKIKFMTPVFHPNVSSQTGAICLDILKDRWTAAMTIRTALLSIQALLTDPVTDDPQDYMVAVKYVENRKEYEKTVVEWKEKYAKEEIMTSNEVLIAKLSEEFDEKDIVRVAMTTNTWSEEKLRQKLRQKQSKE